MTLYEYLSTIPGRTALARHDGQYGIEIETETNSPYPDPRSKFWNIVADGSLRNYGREFVLKAPMSFGAGLEDSLEEFSKFATEIKFNQGSNSTSVHVHINMLNESVRTLCNMLTLYALLEPLLISACGEERKSNLFCLPFHDAGATVSEVQALLIALSGGNFARAIRNLNSDNLKYSGLNIAPLRNLGSIEVRTMEGTTDSSRILSWVNNFELMLRFCREATRNPVEVLSLYLSDRGGFVEAIGIPLNQFTGDILAHLKKGEQVSYDIASIFQDWEKVFSAFENSASKSKKTLDSNLEAAISSLGRPTRRRMAEVSMDEMYQEIRTGTLGQAQSDGAPLQGVNPWTNTAAPTTEIFFEEGEE